MSQHTEGRIDRLEIRLTEQEAVIEDLNATITAQWRALDALKRTVDTLSEAMSEAAERAGAGAPDRPPPHY